MKIFANFSQPKIPYFLTVKEVIKFAVLKIFWRRKKEMVREMN